MRRWGRGLLPLRLLLTGRVWGLRGAGEGERGRGGCRGEGSRAGRQGVAAAGMGWGVGGIGEAEEEEEGGGPFRGGEGTHATLRSQDCNRLPTVV